MMDASIALASGTVEGRFVDEWQPVVDAFVENFKSRHEGGASLCVMVGGAVVVDVWGGVGGRDASAWQENSATVVFSATKGATALCAHILASRGDLELNAKVSTYWPEYARAGKEATTVAMLLDHSAGVPGFREPLPDGAFADWEYMIGRIEREPAWWEPGLQNGYHLINIGWTVGEVVRRVTGQSLGEFFAETVAKPLELEFWIGFPQDLEGRYIDVEPCLPGQYWQAETDPLTSIVQNEPDSLAARAMLNNGGFTAYDPDSGSFEPNSVRARSALIGGAGGVTNGRGLARMYSPLANGGGQLMSPDHVWRMSQTAMVSHRDPILQIPTRFAQGFMKSMDNRPMFGAAYQSVLLGDRAFGHVGAGGSIGFADPDCGLSFGYVMNRMGPGILMNPRGQSLVDAVYSKLGYRSNASGVWTV